MDFGHLWSLSVEEQFYFLWPSVLKRWYKHALVILVGVIVFTPCYEVLLYYGGSDCVAGVTLFQD